MTSEKPSSGIRRGKTAYAEEVLSATQAGANHDPLGILLRFSVLTWRWVVLAVLVVTACSSTDDEAAPEPSERTVPDVIVKLAVPVADVDAVELPDPSESIAEWAAGEGAVAVSVHDKVAGLIEDGSPDCEASAAMLDAVAIPQDLVAAIEAAPEEVTRELFTSEYGALGRALRACGSGDYRERRAELAYQWTVAQLHLADAGVEP